MADRNAPQEMSEHSKDIDVDVHEDYGQKQHDQKTSAPETIESAVRVRRLFSTAQLFMFSLTNMGLWEGMCT